MVFMMNNFKVGDKARVKYVRAGGDSTWHAGIIVTVISTDNSTDFGYAYDCVIEISAGDCADVLFEQLEPLVPEAGSWEKIEEKLGWNPTKEKVNV